MIDDRSRVKTRWEIVFRADGKEWSGIRLARFGGPVPRGDFNLNTAVLTHGITNYPCYRSFPFWKICMETRQNNKWPGQVICVVIFRRGPKMIHTLFFLSSCLVSPIDTLLNCVRICFSVFVSGPFCFLFLVLVPFFFFFWLGVVMVRVRPSWWFWGVQFNSHRAPLAVRLTALMICDPQNVHDRCQPF